MSKIGVVSRASLLSATRDVVAELRRFGFFNQRLEQIKVQRVPLGLPFGWQEYRGSGTISVPRISWSKMSNLLQREYVSLRDILRHEYAHAVADTHQHLIRTSEFARAFGDSHHWASGSDYDAGRFVSAYAASSPAEDFAETFMYFHKYAGLLPARFRVTPIRKKWQYIRVLGKQIALDSR